MFTDIRLHFELSINIFIQAGDDALITHRPQISTQSNRFESLFNHFMGCGVRGAQLFLRSSATGPLLNRAASVFASPTLDLANKWSLMNGLRPLDAAMWEKHLCIISRAEQNAYKGTISQSFCTIHSGIASLSFRIRLYRPSDNGSRLCALQMNSDCQLLLAREGD
ncbi:hypothetical protein HPP92_018658 [Vanilla planifolia]|uniref:Uncharacterized protein n=1 Tax=Vanilla planifolia TaxID=51239 RepID=A0A835UQV4_VANPL|nr:hypothetical protein HPP92_018658 [Vanilla planifolia]